MSHVFTPGSSLALSLTLEGGDTDLYPRAAIYTGGSFIENVDLSHVALGRYTGAWTPASSVDYDAVFIVYDDAPRTQESAKYFRVAERWQPGNVVAASVWAEALPGSFGVGEAGKIVGDNVDATISSRATPTQVKAEADQALTDYDPPTKTEMDAGFTAIPATVWSESIPGAFGAGEAGKVVGDNVDATISSRATPAQVKAQADQALIDYDPPTKPEMDAGFAGIPATVWAETLPGAFGVGEAGKLVGDNVDATISSRATPAQVKAEADQAFVDYDPPTDTEMGNGFAAVPTAVDTELTANHGAGNWTSAVDAGIVLQTFSYNETSDVLDGVVWVELNGVVLANPISCSVSWYNKDGVLQFTMVDGSPDAQGFFTVQRSTPGLISNSLYYALAEVVTSSGTVSAGKGSFTF